MRLWEAQPRGQSDPPTRRDYETVGYVIHGRAELQLEGQMVLLEPGDSLDRAERVQPQLHHSGTVHGRGSDQSACPGAWPR